MQDPERWGFAISREKHEICRWASTETRDRQKGTIVKEGGNT